MSNSKIEKLEERTKQQEERIEELEAALESMQQPSTSRRSVLGALGLAAGGALGGSYAATQTARAQGSGTIGTPDNPLSAIYVDELYQDTEHIDSDSISTEEVSISNTSVRAYLSDNQTISDSTETKVELGSTQFDHFGTFDTSNYHFVVPHDGAYLVSAEVRTSDLSDGTTFQARINVNGSQYGRADRAFTPDQTGASVTEIIDADEGDEIDLRVEHSEGEDAEISGFSDGNLTKMVIARLG